MSQLSTVRITAPKAEGLLLNGGVVTASFVLDLSDFSPDSTSDDDWEAKEGRDYIIVEQSFRGNPPRASAAIGLIL